MDEVIIPGQCGLSKLEMVRVSGGIAGVVLEVIENGYMLIEVAIG